MSQHTYHWQGTDSLGLPQHGEIEARSPDHATSLLVSNGIHSIELNDTNTLIPRFAISFSTHQLTATELAYFSRQLAALLTADISVTDALTTLGESDRTKIRKLVAQLLRDINSGESLSRAMEAHPQAFDKFYVTLIRAGEAAASLPLVLMRLAAEIERKMHLSRRVKQALLQPTLILLTAIIAVTFLLVFVMPQFASLYAEQGQTMPEITRWVLAASKSLENSGGVVGTLAAVVVACVAGSGYLPDYARLRLHRLLLGIPLLGRWSRHTNTAALCHTLATTLSAGIPLTQALPYAAQTCRNDVFRRATQSLAEQVQSGNRLWVAMKETACFLPGMVHLVRLGEETGRLEALLTQAGVQCEERLDQLQSQFLPMIEPALMLLMGCIVGGIILAMYLPVFSMGDLFLP